MKRDVRQQLVVDPVACDGMGICAHLAPETIALDRWGFPVVPTEPLTDQQRAQARRAVRGCAHRALYLRDVGA